MKTIFHFGLPSFALLAIAFALFFGHLFRKKPALPDYATSIPATYSVDANGDGNYSIPLDLPPGTAQISPTLSFNYTTIQQTGIMGVGWQLLGLSEIRRSPATLAQDGFFSYLKYDTTDRYSIDGQRLILVEGSYGGDSAVFHTQVEAWSKVVGYNRCGAGFCSFRVWMKNGLIRDYTATVTAAGNPSVRVWALSRVTDRMGNAMSLDYLVDQKNSAIYPQQITYTINKGIGQYRYVKFNYETQPDSVPTFEGGYPVVYNRRLKSVQSFLGSQAVMTYAIQYQQGLSTGKSQVSKITQCDSDGRCLQPTTVYWQGQNQQFFNAPNTANQPSVPQTGLNMPMDVNGDGRIDFVHAWQTMSNTLSIATYISNGAGYGTPLVQNTNLAAFSNYMPLRSMDTNGDGMIDLVFAAQTQNNQLQYTVLLSDGSKFVQQATVTTPINCYAVPNNLAPLDVNGDGKSDLVFPSQTQQNYLQLQVMLSTGTTFNILPPQVTSINAFSPYPNLVSARVNNDPFEDLVYGYSNSGPQLVIVPLISNGTGFADNLPPLSTTQALDQYTHLMPSDVNGDQLSDMVVSWSSGPNIKMGVFYSNGQSYSETPNSYLQPSFPIQQATIVPMEINGDQKIDFLYNYADQQGNMQLRPYISNGWTFVQQPNLPAPNLPWSQFSLVPADINGDAKSDLVNLATGANFGQSVLTTNLASQPYPDLASAIENGIGARVAVTYKPLTDPSVYTKKPVSGTLLGANNVMNKIGGAAYPAGNGGAIGNGTYGASFPIVNTVSPMYVVARFVQYDGTGNAFPYDFAYSGAKIDLSGYGWLGFESKTMVDSSDNSRASTVYHQLFPLTTKIRSTTQQRLSDGATISRLRLLYTAAPVIKGNNHIQQVLQLQSRADYFTYGKFNYTTGNNYAYDSYGNITLLTELNDTSLQNNTAYTIQRYQYDPLHWQLGLLISKKVAADSLGKQLLSWDQYSFLGNSWLPRQESRWVEGSLWLSQTYTYDPYGNKTNIIDFNNDTTTLVYDPVYQTFAQTIVQAPNAQGKRLKYQYAYDPRFGQLSSKTDANGNTTRTLYNGVGKVWATLGPSPTGDMDTLTLIKQVPQKVGYYQEMEVKTSWKNDSSQWVRNYVDGLEHTISVVSETNTPGVLKITDRKLDSKARPIAETVPYFNTSPPSAIFWTRTVYDPYDRIIRSVQPKGNGDSMVTQISYPHCNVVRTLQAAGTADSALMIVEYQYFKSQKQIVKSTDPTGKTTTYLYDVLGRIVGGVDPLGLSSVIQYNGLGQRTYFQDNTLGAVNYSYDYPLRTIKQAYANGKWQTSQFDPLQRLLNKFDSDGDTTRYQYDVAAVKNGLGNLTNISMPGNIAYEHSYDAYGNLASIALRYGGYTYTSLQTYTPNHLPDQLTYPDGSVLRYGYTTEGGIASIELDDAADGQSGNFKNMASYQQFTARGEPQLIALGNNTNEYFNWYSNGLVSSRQVKLPDNSIVVNDSLVWNYRNLLQSVSSAVNSKFNQNYVYDRANRLLQAQTAGQNFGYSYDKGGNLTKEGARQFFYQNYQLQNVVSGKDTLVKTEFDQAGSLIAKQKKDSTFRYVYDASFNLDSVYLNGKALYDFGYDDNNSRLLKKNLADGSSTLYVSPNYLINISNKGVSSHTKYLIGPSGMIAAVETPGPRAKGLVIKHQRQAWGDTRRSHSFWTSIPTIPLPTLPPGLLSWIGYCLLIGLNLAFLLLVFRQYYGRFFLRFKLGAALTEGFWGSLPKKELALPFMFAGITFTASGFENGPTEAPAPKAGSNITYFHQNFNYSTTLSTDQTGKVLEMLSYLPYGGVAEANGSNDVRFKFSNKELDSSSELYYFNARYYDSDLCRFNTADSQLGGNITQPDVFNRYAYALNSPLNFVDPTGHGIFSWFASLLVDILEVVAGVAITALSDGALSVIGETLIGAGINAGIYTATHFSNFSWRDWGIQDAIGAAMGLGFAGLGAAADAAGAALRGGAEAAETAASEIGESAAGRLCMREVGGNEDMVFAEFDDDGVTAVNAQCFTAGTLVQTESGYKKIEDVALGDRVWSYNESTGKTELNEVVRLFRNEKSDLYAVKMDSATLNVTSEHPFFKAECGWTLTENLRVGDEIITIKGITATITAVERLQGTYQVYNFEVEQAHTYFVSNASVLAHNQCYTQGVQYDVEVPISRSRWPESAQHIEDAQNAGHPDVLTIARGGARANRADSLYGIPTRSGFDRDEYPPAMFEEGGSGASVRYINPSDNRGSGSYFGNFLRHTNNGGIWPDQTRVWFHVVP